MDCLTKHKNKIAMCRNKKASKIHCISSLVKYLKIYLTLNVANYKDTPTSFDPLNELNSFAKYVKTKSQLFCQECEKTIKINECNCKIK